MEEKKSIFTYAEQVLSTFGFSMVFLLLFDLLFGDSAKEVSTMFALGRAGISIATMLQFLAFSVLIVLARYLCFTDRVMKKASVTLRTILMLTFVIAAGVTFICLFRWFPVTMWQPWAMFFLCFTVCFIVSAWVTSVKTKLEDKRLEEGLKHLKNEWEEKENGSTQH